MNKKKKGNIVQQVSMANMGHFMPKELYGLLKITRCLKIMKGHFDAT